MSTAASVPGVLQMLAVQLAAFLALLLFASGMHKLLRRGRIQRVVHAFAGVPRAAAPLAALAAAAAELAAGAMLWVPECRAAGGLSAALIWGGYLVLLARAIRQGRRDVDCGCSFGSVQHAAGFHAVLRNALLIGAALLVSGVAMQGLTPQASVSQVLAACALLALYGALDASMALTPPRAGVAS